jgi:hypothetical protein
VTNVGLFVKYVYLGYLSQCSFWLQTVRPGLDPWQRQRIYPLAFVSRPALRLTQLPVQRVIASFSRGKARPGRDADHSPHLVPSSGMSRSYTSLPLSAYVAYKGELYFSFTMLSSTYLNSSVLLHGPHIHTSSCALNASEKTLRHMFIHSTFHSAR